MFNFAQVFFLDKSIVKNSLEIQLSRIDLYFKNKPHYKINKSGIINPGVTVFITPTIDGVPILNLPPDNSLYIDKVYSRLDYNQIFASSDASLASSFIFTKPISLKTNRSYAIIVKFDGNEDFELWESKVGDYLVGTTIISPGPSNSTTGNLYTYISPLISLHSPIADSNNVTDDAGTFSDTNGNISTDVLKDYALSKWRPHPDRDLKFRISVSRYSHNGVFIEANATINATPSWDVHIDDDLDISYNGNVATISFASEPLEFILYDPTISEDENLHSGDFVYQEKPYFAGGKVTPQTVSVVKSNNRVTANGSFILSNGANFSWNPLVETSNTEFNDKFLVIVSENHYGSGNNAVNIRKFISRLSNTVITVDKPLTFSNSIAKFFFAPVGRVINKHKTIKDGINKNVLLLSDSNANATVRFVNSSISTATLHNSGTGYANSDYIIISGYEFVSGEVIGGANGYANIQTDASGNITTVFVSNKGAGFTNTDAIVITYANSTGGASNGSGANISFSVSSIIKTETSGGSKYFANVIVDNMEAKNFIPMVELNNPAGTNYIIKHKAYYYKQISSNTLSGYKYHTYADSEVKEYTVKNGMEMDYIANSTTRVIVPSRSNQFNIPYSNGSVANVVPHANRYAATKMSFDITSNNDYSTIIVTPGLVQTSYSSYLINNSYALEETNYGDAYSKHISKKIYFQNNRFSEDLLVYMKAYRPLGTDIKVYARMHNSNDDEAFDDKDWTLLELQDGVNVYSSLSNPDDFKSYTFGITQYPNSEFTISGYVTTQLSNSIVIGSNTNFSNLVANDVVKIYSPLFPENYILDVVDTVTNSTHIVLKNSIANNGVVGNGFKMDKIEFPHQVFRNITSDNVARYYNSSMVLFETYNTLQLKLVFQSNNENIVAEIDDISGIGVSA